jgi:hypothetical protein
VGNWAGTVVAANGVVRAIQRTKARVMCFNQEIQHHVCPIGYDLMHLRVRIAFGVQIQHMTVLVLFGKLFQFVQGWILIQLRIFRIIGQMVFFIVVVVVVVVGRGIFVFINWNSNIVYEHGIQCVNEPA